MLFPGLIGLASTFINQNDEELNTTGIVLLCIFSVCFVLVIVAIVKLYMMKTEYTITSLNKGKMKALPSFILNQVLRTTSKVSDTS